MIHYVIKEVDEGAPLLVKELPMIEGESIEDLESRMHDLGQYPLLARRSASLIIVQNMKPLLKEPTLQSVSCGKEENLRISLVLQTRA